MRVTNFLLALCGMLFTAVNAAAMFEGKPFEVTQVRITTAMNMTSFRFTVRDPEPLADESAVCVGTWEAGSTEWEVDGYAPCLGNTTLAWQMESFNSIRDFTFGIQHSFSDPAIGRPPYDRVKNFARAEFNSTMEQALCTPTNDARGNPSCQQLADTIIDAPIHASIAKRR
ncbi:hypothetical protein MBLNU230_g1953t1 [Neophaeotheca triangularis]